MALQVDPAGFTDVSLGVGCFHPAIELVTVLIERLIHVHLEEPHKIDWVRPTLHLGDLVP